MAGPINDNGPNLLHPPLSRKDALKLADGLHSLSRSISQQLLSVSADLERMVKQSKQIDAPAVFAAQSKIQTVSLAGLIDGLRQVQTSIERYPALLEYLLDEASYTDAADSPTLNALQRMHDVFSDLTGSLILASLEASYGNE